jgi:hypothetical protein
VYWAFHILVLRRLFTVFGIGSSFATQSVFTTNEQSFSQSDLSSFQSSNGLTEQEAISVGGHNVSACNLGSGAGQCYEGNLDIQYIMGMAQVTTSTYYYVPSTGSPFVSAYSLDHNSYNCVMFFIHVLDVAAFTTADHISSGLNVTSRALHGK